ncbi:hypothetical protein [Pseudorhodoferax sp. Leaf267]|uniref:hypothetical protein n=1 Tax=Pseudorhodoferax sp. Leaf267 TaxID=1736316 RepID=UPI0006F5D030|nr:hypothetical protein [Pseudorhodoferax sp. Leaf267]KQP20497.1 hypothetical protein ASF43_27060 [Pseudorhodoferax sp. Leaf267]
MIEQFIAMTHRVIEEEGFEDYLPTLLRPQRKDVRVLDGIPEGDDIESQAKDWAECSVDEDEDEDFILAFKADASHFKVVARVNGINSETVCDVNIA